MIFVEARINGQGPFPFILDTGASETVITPPTARQLGIRGLSVAPDQDKGHVESLSVGGVSVRNLPVFITDPPQALPLRLDKGIDYRGLLGHTFLKRFIMTIDYAGRRLRLVSLEQQPNALVVPHRPGVSSARFDVREGMIYARGAVNAKGPVTFLVDTGSAEILLLPGAAQSLGVLSTPASGHHNVGFTQLDRVSLGGATALNLPAIVHRLDREGIRRLSYHGILGTPFLSNFTVTISYRDRLIILEDN